MPRSSQNSAFGYVVLSPFGGMAEYSALAGPLGAFAKARRYSLRGIFVDELGRNDVSSFHGLLRAVRLGKTTVVVVPDFDHLAHLPCLVGADERTMARYIRARVVSVAQETVREPVSPGAVTTGLREFASVGW